MRLCQLRVVFVMQLARCAGLALHRGRDAAGFVPPAKVPEGVRIARTVDETVLVF